MAVNPEAALFLSQQNKMFMENVLINTVSMNHNRLPTVHGEKPIKTEPVDVDFPHNPVDGNDRNFDRKHPSRFEKVTYSDKRLNGLAVTMVDSTAPNVCQICNKWFRSRQQVAQHMLVHTDERRYKCAYCDRAFKQASHLQQHHRIHTGEKPYRCTLPGCARAFPQLSNLNHHIRNHDKPDPPLSNTCPYCKRVYASDAVLRTHLEKIHSDKTGVLANDAPEGTEKTTPSKPRSKYHINNNNFIKIAPAPKASMTVTPPVLNYSQAFLSPYVHDLNYVRLPVNLANYAPFPVDSKMSLPVTMPAQNDGHSRSSETIQVNGVRKASDKNNDNIKNNNDLLSLMKIADPQFRYFQINRERKDEILEEKQSESSDSDDETTEKIKLFDDIALKSDTQYNYQYTLDDIVEEGKVNLVGINGQNGVTSIQEDDVKESQNVVNSCQGASAKHNEVFKSAVCSMSGDKMVVTTLENLQRGNAKEGPMDDDDICVTPIKNDNEKFEEISSATLEQRVIGYQLDGETPEPAATNSWKVPSELCQDDSKENATGEYSEQLNTHSRKRKAFRPQRVVHDKVFVQDNDVH